MDFKEKAKELAEAIKETEQFKDLKSAETRVKLDPTAQDLLEKFNDFQGKIMESQQKGEMPSQELYQNIKQIQQQMGQNLTIKNLMKAQEEFNKVMQEVNKEIYQSLTQ